MITAEQISSILDEIIADNKFYLVDLKLSKSKIKRKITVLIDSDEGISIDECGAISRELGNRLEEEIDSAFTLEVSSPGVDFPLKLNRQYTKNIGRTLNIQTVEGSEVKGELTHVSDSHIVIQPAKKKKEKNLPEPVSLGFEEIKEAKVQISFK
ncbi:MAG: ribosome maturation factor RimP [Cytophagales bacterium]|nr:ribosome maturation factor RimP [Cytophagales bacterium]